MKFVAIVIISVVLLFAKNCQKPVTPQQAARDTAAALNGFITSAQTKYLDSCTANKQQYTCVVINEAIGAQNALITADQAYCGWNATVQPTDPNAVCVPVKNAEQALITSINNAVPFINQLRDLVK